MKRLFSLFLMFSLAAVLVSAQEPPVKPPEMKPPAADQPKPYDQVVTADFKTQTGVFKIHTSKGKLLLEIPPAELDRDFLLVVQIKGSPSAASYPGQGVDDMVVRWELRENKVLLKAISYANIADPTDPIKKAVDMMNTPTIIMAFNVEALAADGSPVIDAGKLFTSDVNEIPVKRRVGGQNIDGSRSFLEKVRVFPANLNVEALQTFNPKPATLPGRFPSAVCRHAAVPAEPDGPRPLFLRQAPRKADDGPPL